MEVTSFPAEPWRLHGDGLLTVGLLPSAAAETPPGTRPVRWRGRAVVGVALLTYAEPSPLTYHEILTAILVRRGLRPFVHITRIWVDSPASAAGGRALWAIPKELAIFDDGRRAVGIGAATASSARWSVPAPARFRVAQQRDGQTLTTPVRGVVRIWPTRARWTFDADGPLADLGGLAPLLRLRIGRFRLTFGPADPSTRH